MAIIVDTGAILALIDKDDRYHAAVARYVAKAREPLLVPSPVIPEVCYRGQENVAQVCNLRRRRRAQLPLTAKAFSNRQPQVANLRHIFFFLKTIVANLFADLF